MKTVYLVTGGTGFVGNNVIRLLAEKGAEIRTLVRSEEKAREALGGLEVKLYYGDVRDLSSLKQMFNDGEDCEYILIHTAAKININGYKFIQEMHDINVGGVNNVLRVCKEKNVKRLVYVSSVHAVPELPKRALIHEIDAYDPKKVIGAYAKTKAEASAKLMAAVKDGLNAVIVHPSGIIGPNDFSNSHLTQMAIDYYEGKIPAAVKGGYDFVDVRDVAAAILSATEKGEPGSRWLITNKFYTIRELLDELQLNIGNRKIKVTLPMWLARFSVPFLSFYFKINKKMPLYTSYSLYTVRSNGNFCHEKADKELDFKPRDFKTTIHDTVEFLKTTGRIK